MLEIVLEEEGLNDTLSPSRLRPAICRLPSLGSISQVAASFTRRKVLKI